jgi:hypothetical protein
MKKSRLGIAGITLVALLASGCGEATNRRKIENVPEANGYDVQLTERESWTSLWIRDFDDDSKGYILMDNYKGASFVSENRAPEDSPLRKLGSYEDFTRIYEAISN